MLCYSYMFCSDPMYNSIYITTYFVIQKFINIEMHYFYSRKRKSYLDNANKAAIF